MPIPLPPMFRQLKPIVAAIALAIITFGDANAQQAGACGTYQVMEELFKTYPEYAREFEYYKDQVRLAQQQPVSSLRQLPTKTIPVVVHIIYNGGFSNISDAQVHNAIEVLNEDFNKLNSDITDVVPAFSGISADIGIQFKLAQLDPNGNCTTGITRTLSSFSNSAGENVKGLIRWTPSKYLNIWVVQNIASGAGGYSILPCAPVDADGIVIRNSQFGTIGTSSPWGLAARSLTHEVGHYLGLPHTWGHSNSPGLASNCSTDDGIADTPNTVGVDNGSCNTNAVSCGGLNNVQNFMDYSNCPKMFTEGQKAVIQNALQLACRTNLWSPANLSATGTNDGFQISACTPSVAFEADVQRICQGDVVHFDDLSESFAANPNTGRLWSFPGGIPATSTDPEPVVLYPAPGVYSVTLAVTNAGGTTTLEKTDHINVISTTSNLQLPVSESFESPDFPVVPAQPDQSWEKQSSTTNTWTRTSQAKADGDFSIRIQQQYIPVGRVNSLLTPNINLSGVASPELRFKIAYALPTASNTGNDRLKVTYSADCGKTWFSLYDKSGATLATAVTPESNFVPVPAEWREETVNLPTNADFVMLKFESISGNANALYLDAVQIVSGVTGTAALQEINGLKLYPNPAQGETTLEYVAELDGIVSVKIKNALGQEVYNSTENQSAGRQIHAITNLQNKLCSGVYLVEVKTPGKTFRQKLICK